MTKRRFSPGFGDLDLSAQADLAEWVGAGRIGITVTPSFILSPEKSVLGLAGVL